jgi:hypothetical protein
MGTSPLLMNLCPVIVALEPVMNTTEMNSEQLLTKFLTASPGRVKVVAFLWNDPDGTKYIVTITTVVVLHSANRHLIILVDA